MLARTLYATPLRLDAAGRVTAGLCSSWSADAGFATWRFRCRSAGAIAAELRRVGSLRASPARWLFAGARVTTPKPGSLVVRLPFAWRRFPFALTSVAAAPRGVPGPFRLVRGSRRVVVARRGATTVEFRRLDPAAAVRAFRAGALDEAPVPADEVQLLRGRGLDVRARELLGLDVVVFGSGVGRKLRRAYADTANRNDYQTLLDTSAAYGVLGGSGRNDPAAFRNALKMIPTLPRVALRVARRPELAYGADILYGQWREAGLGPVLVGAGVRHDGELLRLFAPYPQAEALPAELVLGRGVGRRAAMLQALARVNQDGALTAVDDGLRGDARAIPIAWVTDARLVSRRLRGWREDVLGGVDYARVAIAR